MAMLTYGGSLELYTTSVHYPHGVRVEGWGWYAWRLWGGVGRLHPPYSKHTLGLTPPGGRTGGLLLERAEAHPKGVFGHRGSEMRCVLQAHWVGPLGCQWSKRGEGGGGPVRCAGVQPWGWFVCQRRPICGGAKFHPRGERGRGPPSLK